ncbi:hypothetical protein CEXT_699101 [Caerostris extrusa]|uniref:Uncharacterized protein n=1 Tax=Caerostris extrusa TaxID=172846 RepID=A0AAV4VXJ7_CAEEX|nr:hypothetical protein CEXT_699101 [Caerostris extrusa]
MCEHDKLHIRNPTVDWTSTAYYATLDIHHHHFPSQLVRQNSIDRAYTPALIVVFWWSDLTKSCFSQGTRTYKGN